MNSIIGQHHQMAGRTMQAAMEKKLRSQPDESLKCPRCDSTNTKFCYYNNYSLSQPRYFCKLCRRYWTKGGTLRNVPVGEGCRRTRRSVTSSSSRIRTHDHDSISPFAPVAYESPDFAPFMRKLISGHGTYYEIPYQSPFTTVTSPLWRGSLTRAKAGSDFWRTTNVMLWVCATGLESGPCPRRRAGNATSISGENNNRVFLEFPWQVNGGDGNCVNLVDAVNSSGRGGWNYGNGISSSSSSWYNGLVNSPLM